MEIKDTTLERTYEPHYGLKIVALWRRLGGGLNRGTMTDDASNKAGGPTRGKCPEKKAHL